MTTEKTRNFNLIYCREHGRSRGGVPPQLKCQQRQNVTKSPLLLYNGFRVQQ